MLGQYAEELNFSTRGRGFYEITRDVSGLVSTSGFATGLVTLHVRHTSASLLIQENADPSVRTDLESVFARLAPDADPVYEHNYEGDDDMAAHVRTALTNVNLSIPIVNGSMVLGTWQGIYLWEHRTRPHTRCIHVHIVGD
ncbi:MAG TPA: secondary thiamine-phosphate synthase enzyme YjbQ [Verrucomicrobiota bacterium]|nr:secondary thiamine-phosphate synthase enzyme YjbQ [Verrucomicrobiota bacterium]